MGDSDAKQLLAENSKLKNEQKELSSVLVEERDMVKYLHGVIKNYEHLLRTNSKRQYHSRPVLINKNLTDSEIDPAPISSEEEENKVVHRSTSTPCLPGMRSSIEKRPESPLAVNHSYNERHNIMHGLQTVKQQVKQQQDDDSIQDPSCVEDDMRLEDLEDLSISSSDDNSTDSSPSLPDMNRKYFNERKLSSNGRNPRFYKQTSRDRGTQPVRQFDHSISPSHGNHSKTHLTNRTIHNNENTGGNSTGTRTTTSTFDHQESKSMDSELQELNKELDKIARELNNYEKSVVQSEKHLSKIEHRMEYLESFALGEESEYL